MHQNLSIERIEHVLKSELLGYIGCHENDLPYIVPICYAYNGACIYGRTFEGMKMKIMRENPSVCFYVEYVDNTVGWQNILCWGVFEELTEINKRDKGIEILQNRVAAVIGNKTLERSPHWPFAQSESDNMEGIIFCIHLHKKTGRIEMGKFDR